MHCGEGEEERRNAAKVEGEKEEILYLEAKQVQMPTEFRMSCQLQRHQRQTSGLLLSSSSDAF